MKTLPSLPSDLLDLALDDLEYVEAHPETYIVDMFHWHTPDNRCRVCLAGSVLAHTVGLHPKKVFDPDTVDKDGLFDQLAAIDAFRCGYVGEALEYLNCGCPPEFVNDLEIPFYENNPSAFKSNLRNLATQLREKGL